MKEWVVLLEACRIDVKVAPLAELSSFPYFFTVLLKASQMGDFI
jgi:hypothetical protein